MVLKRILAASFLVLCALFVISCSQGNEADVNGYIVKIDGKEIGCVENEADVDALIEALESKKREEISLPDAEIIRISVNSKIESVPALCD